MTQDLALWAKFQGSDRDPFRRITGKTVPSPLIHDANEHFAVSLAGA
jgi:hypothetical protein